MNRIYLSIIDSIIYIFYNLYLYIYIYISLYSYLNLDTLKDNI